MKKVIVIFLVALILFALVVPCFADSPPDYQVYLSQVYTSAILNASQWIDAYNRDNLQFIVSDISYSGLEFRTTSRFKVGHTYLISYYGSASVARRITWNFYNSSTGSYFKQITQSLTTEPVFYTHTYTLETTCNYFWLFRGYDMPSGTQVNIQYLNILDVTDIISPTQYYNPQSYVTDGWYYLPDTFQPLGDFYSNMWHSFDWLGDLFTKHSALLVAVTISLSLSGIALCVILAIKRFKE